jgi:hypothetical protein
MKLRLGLVALALVLCAGAANAQAQYRGALGFHDLDAPIGIRWWLGDKLGFDAGLGFGSNEIADESFSFYAIDLGLPVMLKQWDRVHFMVRPGIVYRSQEVDILGGPGVDKDNDTFLTIQGELEAEVFLADNFSVSAAHGLAIVNTDPAVGDSSTDYGTTGANFTNIGFHVYLFGAK